jgi:hypothetical protein
VEEKFYGKRQTETKNFASTSFFSPSGTSNSQSDPVMKLSAAVTTQLKFNR